MQKIIKKVLLWCMALLLISTMHPISASAATKKVDLKTPVIYNWKKQEMDVDSTPADGVEYTVTWSIRIPG